MTRVLVLVVSSEREPWRTIERRGQRMTWAAVPIPDVPVLFYYGTPASIFARGTGLLAYGLRAVHAAGTRERYLSVVAPRHVRRSVHREGSRIWTGVPDNFIYMGARQRAAVRHVLATESFDFLLRTNVSAYVHLARLKAYVSRLPKARYYGGLIDRREQNSEGVSYVAGAGVLMSRDVADIVAWDDAWQYGRADDVAIGYLLQRHGIEPDPIPRLDIARPDDRLDLGKLQECFLVRCKSGAPPEGEIEIMHKVHAAYMKSASGGEFGPPAGEGRPVDGRPGPI
jgi:hypothetical protein